MWPQIQWHLEKNSWLPGHCYTVLSKSHLSPSGNIAKCLLTKSTGQLRCKCTEDLSNCVQGESFIKCYGQGKNFQNWITLERPDNTTNSLKGSPCADSNSPWVLWWVRHGSTQHALGYSSSVHLSPSPSHRQCSILPWTFHSRSCGPAFSKMGADSKEQRHCLAQPEDASAPCSFSGPHHVLGEQCSFLLTSLPSHLLTEPFHLSFPFTTGVWFYSC